MVSTILTGDKGFSVIAASWEIDRQRIMDIRREVFIMEQQVPEELEWDGRDETALHVLAGFAGASAGTGRLLPTGQIGRLAVRRDLRSRGIGTAILRALMDLSCEKEIDSLFLNAQLQAVDFYRKQGFVQTGEYFDEAGIMHCRMEYRSV